jgi:hypothetical protein
MVRSLFTEIGRERRKRGGRDTHIYTKKERERERA